MGAFDGIKHDHNQKDDTKFSTSDFHFINNILQINKNLRFILHRAQYSDQFKITNDMLSLDKDRIEINPKSIVKIDPITSAPKGTIMVDSDDKLKLNYISDFYTDFNSSLWLNIGPGMERDSQNRISISLGCQGVRFINNKFCLDVGALINNTSGSITVENEERLELNYSPDDFMKDSTGKI